MTTTARRRSAVGLLAAAGLVATVLMAALGPPYGGSHREAFAHLHTFPANGNATHLHIDADADNGWRPCDPIDETATVAVGATHRVAVCIENYVPGSIGHFLLHIWYTGDPDVTPPTTINTAPTLRCPLTADPACLNANPDANDGTGPDKLGTGWDCLPLFGGPPYGSPPPVGDLRDTLHVADAFAWCSEGIASPDQDLSADPGLLATITFTATGAGVDTIDFGPIDENNTNYVARPRPGLGWARCGTEVPAEQVGCFGATIFKGVTPTGTPTDTPMPTPTDTPTPPPSDTPTPTPTSTSTSTATPQPDTDGDTVPDSVDNCPLVPNPDQNNSDSGPRSSGSGAIGNGASIAGDDRTVPNGDSLGDACDPDLDNDGIPNASDPDPGGDITYDDNGNGDPCVPLGTDAADDGPSWDSNCNGVLDGVEGSCPLAVNPKGDDDGDGLLNTWEVCKWGTDPTKVDTDGDVKGDCIEAADNDGNGLVDFGGDAINNAKSTLLPAGIVAGKFGRDGDFDINGNNVLGGDFGGDSITVAKMAFKIPGSPCK